MREALRADQADGVRRPDRDRRALPAGPDGATSRSTRAARTARSRSAYPDPRLEADHAPAPTGSASTRSSTWRSRSSIAGFSPAEADDLRKAIGKKIHSLMASLKSKFLEGCAASGTAAGVAQQLWADMEQAQDYSFNKSHAACYALIVLPHRLAAGEPPAGVHGRAHLLGDEHEGQGAVLRRRVRRARDRGAAARRERVAGRLRRRRGEDPLRPQRREERRRGHVPRDRRGAGGGRPVRLDLGLHRARRPVGREQALARVARLGRGARLDRRLAAWGCSTVLEDALSYGQKLQQDRLLGQASIFDLGDSPARLVAPPRADSGRRVRKGRRCCGWRRRASASTSPSIRSAPSATSCGGAPTARSWSSSGGARARPSSPAAWSPACGRRRRRRASRWRSSSSRT